MKSCFAVVWMLCLVLPRPAAGGFKTVGGVRLQPDHGGFEISSRILPPAAAPQAASRILVVPFENTRHDLRLHWLSEACAVLLADELNARGVGAITREERVRAFEELHLPLSASLTRATVIKVGQIVGASEVIVGAFVLDDGRLTISAHGIRVEVGRLQPELTEQAPLADLFAVVDRLGRRLAPGSVDVPRGSRPPLDAFENYIKGLIAESPAAQATFLETAVKQFAGYDRAELALWGVRTDQDDHVAALAAARSVPAASPLARRARFLAGVSLLELKRYDEAFDLFKALVDEAPVSAAGPRVRGTAAALNNLGVVQIRRGGTPQTGTAAFYLTKAAEADPGDADYLFNLGYAYVLERNHQGAIYWLREALRRNPSDPDAHYVLAAALQASGNTVEAAREKELARQLSAQYRGARAARGGREAAGPQRPRTGARRARCRDRFPARTGHRQCGATRAARARDVSPGSRAPALRARRRP